MNSLWRSWTIDITDPLSPQDGDWTCIIVQYIALFFNAYLGVETKPLAGAVGIWGAVGLPVRLLVYQNDYLSTEPW